MSYTREEIKLEPIALDDPANRSRGRGRRYVWLWFCPGSHPYPTQTYAVEEYGLSEGDILRDPMCYYCRRKGAKQ